MGYSGYCNLPAMNSWGPSSPLDEVFASIKAARHVADHEAKRPSLAVSVGQTDGTHH